MKENLGFSSKERLSDSSFNNEIKTEENLFDGFIERQNDSSITEQEENMNIGEKIRCPQCFNNTIIKMDLENYKITSDCGKHLIKNTDLLKYIIDSNKHQDKNIPCHTCKKDNIENMYKCYCGSYFCDECKENHLQENENDAENHNMEEVKLKDFSCCCSEDPINFSSFCKKCKKNLCYECQSEHDNHEIFDFDKKMLKKAEIEKIKNEFKNQQENLKLFYKILSDWKDKLLQKVDLLKKHLQIVVNMNKKVIESYKEEELCYESIINMRNLKFRFNDVFYDLLNTREEEWIRRDSFIKILLNYQDSTNIFEFNRSSKTKTVTKYKEISKWRNDNKLTIKIESTLRSICDLKKAGLLAIGTENGQIHIYDNNSLTDLFSIHGSSDPAEPIDYLHELNNGNLFVCTKSFFKIIEISKQKEYINKQTQKFKESRPKKYEKICGDQVLELPNGNIITIEGSLIKLWQKNLFNENFEENKIIDDVGKFIHYIIGISDYKFGVYTEDGKIKLYDTKEYKNIYDLSSQNFNVNNNFINRVYRLSDDTLILFTESKFFLLSLVNKGNISDPVNIEVKHVGVCLLNDKTNRLILSYEKNNGSGFGISEMKFEPTKDSMDYDLNSRNFPFKNRITHICTCNSRLFLIFERSNCVYVFK